MLNIKVLFETKYDQNMNKFNKSYGKINDNNNIMERFLYSIYDKLVSIQF